MKSAKTRRVSEYSVLSDEKGLCIGSGWAVWKALWWWLHFYSSLGRVSDTVNPKFYRICVVQTPSISGLGLFYFACMLPGLDAFLIKHC